jgi:hypothetical protein
LPNPWRFRCGSFRVGSKQARHIGLLRARRLQSAQTKIIVVKTSAPAAPTRYIWTSLS